MPGPLVLTPAGQQALAAMAARTGATVGEEAAVMRRRLPG